MGYGRSSTPDAIGSISGLYLDSQYYLHYPKGLKMTDGIPEDVMTVVDPHVGILTHYINISTLLMEANGK
jgi:hypothetical protein